MRLGIFVTFWFIAVCFAQAPTFTSDRVLAGEHAIPLAPGLLLSIYGDHLGPQMACQGQADQHSRETASSLRPRQTFVETLIYPKQLCDTQVLVGGIPAGLLYVSEKQINFKVPQEVPIQGTTELQIIYKGSPSSPVKVPLGLASAILSLETPTEVGMPVWLKVSMPGGDQLMQYPFQIWPSGFGCHQIEVRRDGKLLTPFATLETQAFRGIAGSLGPCGMLGLPAESKHLGRLPLHLRYRFDQAGTYEVQYTLRADFQANALPVISSSWTPITIQPAAPGERARWLTRIRLTAPKSTVELLTDFLPGILGIPDQQTLALLSDYLYHPDNLVRQFAMYGLTYWPKDTAREFVLKTAQTKGLSDVIAEFLSGDGQALVDIAIPYLKSDSPVLLRGAVTAIYRAADSLSSKDRARADAAMMANSEHIVNRADDQTKNDYAAALGTFQEDHARSILWSFVDRKIARGQSLIALTWRHSPADLPRLAGLALVPANGNNLDYDVANLPYALHRAYGAAALPYLENLLQRSEFTLVRTNCARELVSAGKAKGFEFMADAIQSNKPYRREMIQFLHDQFPDLRNADDTTILTFVKGRQ